MMVPTAGELSRGEDVYAVGREDVAGAVHAMSPHDNPALNAEHDALMTLVPDHAVTSRAVRDGDWSDPGTWADGRVPGDGAVVAVPDEITVRYDTVSSESILHIRVDGTLEFATDRDTLLEVDTIVVVPEGTLRIGTAGAPVDGAHEARIVFADNGAVAWSAAGPTQLHRGLVSEGRVEMHGEAKAASLKLAADPMAGDRSITLADMPEGWRPGDKIVLTGTHFAHRTGVLDPSTGSREITGSTEDEVLTIDRIEGRTVVLLEPLRFDHDTPAADLKAYAANLSRNIVLTSENTEIAHRGHVMLMHSDDIDIANVEFLELGRTDKSRRLDDKMEVEHPDGSITAIPADPTGITNQRGRYPIHVHRTGPELDGQAAEIAGSVVWGSPGWGFAQHDAYANLTDNVSFDVFGAHFVAETGNETGEWAHNIAIQSGGRKRESVVESLATHDNAFEGAGFWFNGRQIVATRNVAAGVAEGAFTWFTFGDGAIDIEAENLPEPLVASYRDAVHPSTVPIEGFAHNEAIASAMGFRSFRQQTVGHADLSHIIDFTAWETEVGVALSYTNNYLFEDLRIFGTATPTRALLGSVAGVSIGLNSEMITVKNALIDNVDEAISMRKLRNSAFIRRNDRLEDDYQYTFIDVESGSNVDRAFSVNLDRRFDRVMTEEDLVLGRLALALDDSSLLVKWGDNPLLRNIDLTGIKTDSVGAVDFPARHDRIRIEGDDLMERLRTDGFSTLLDGTRVIELATLASDRGTGETLTRKFLAVLAADWQIPADAIDKGTWWNTGEVYVPTTLVDPAAVATHTVRSDGREVVLGSGRDDTLIDPLGAGRILDGGAGHDRVSGQDRNATLFGRAGADVMTGGGGSDRLLGDGGDDVLGGGDGDDTLLGGAGDDVLSGGIGNDTLIGGPGVDRLNGGGGADLFVITDADPATFDIIGRLDALEGDRLLIHIAALVLPDGSLDGSRLQRRNVGLGKEVRADIYGDGVFDTIARIIGGAALDPDDFLLGAITIA